MSEQEQPSKPTFEIDFPETHGRHGRVIMDGVELRGVYSVSLTGSCEDRVELTLTFIPAKVIARLHDPVVAAKVKTLFADVTAMQDTNRVFAKAEVE
jgi:hypothetical protein